MSNPSNYHTLEGYGRGTLDIKNDGEDGHIDVSHPISHPISQSSPTASLIVHLVSARNEEALATRKVFAHASGRDWSSAKINGRVSYQTLDLTSLRIYLTFPADQGGDFMLTHLKDCVSHFRPDLCIMTGICAGQRGKINLGDVVVATQAFNYERGKRTDRGLQAQPVLFASDGLDAWMPWIQATMSTKQWASHVIHPHPKFQISATDWLKRALREYQKGVEHSEWLWTHGFDRSKSILENKNRIPEYDVNLKKLIDSKQVRLENLQLRLSEAAIQEIDQCLALYGDYPAPSEKRMQSSLHYGVYASGSSVRADTKTRKYKPWGSQNLEAEEKVSQSLEDAKEQYRDTAAVEMEGAAFYQALKDTGIKAICVKGVSDYGDDKKDDQIHPYAKEAAASFAWELIQAYQEFKMAELNAREDAKKN